MLSYGTSNVGINMTQAIVLFQHRKQFLNRRVTHDVYSLNKGMIGSIICRKIELNNKNWNLLFLTKKKPESFVVRRSFIGNVNYNLLGLLYWV